MYHIELPYGVSFHTEDLRDIREIEIKETHPNVYSIMMGHNIRYAYIKFEVVVEVMAALVKWHKKNNA